MQYAAQMNRHSINVLKDKVDETAHDVNNLYNLTTSLATVLEHNHWYMINSSDIMISQCVEAKQLSYPSKQLQW